jgi:hypothetical protein
MRRLQYGEDPPPSRPGALSPAAEDDDDETTFTEVTLDVIAVKPAKPSLFPLLNA